MMRNALVLGAALVALAATPSFASDDFVDVNSTQENFGDIQSDITGSLRDIGKATTVSSLSVANNISVEVDADADFDNFQQSTGDALANVGMSAEDLGSLELSATALQNNASFEAEGSDYLELDSVQLAHDSTIGQFNGSLKDLGSVEVSTAGIGNNLSTSALGNIDYMDVRSEQLNSGLARASIGVNVNDVAGKVSLSSSAIGNNISVNTRATRGDNN